MLQRENSITVKQLLFLLIGKGINKCEIWDLGSYLKTHVDSKSYKSSEIASKYIDNLVSNGITYNKAQKLVILNGNPKLSKKNLRILGKPLITGSVDELSNNVMYWERMVCDIQFNGLFKQKVIIILYD